MVPLNVDRGPRSPSVAKGVSARGLSLDPCDFRTMRTEQVERSHYNDHRHSALWELAPSTTQHQFACSIGICRCGATLGETRLVNRGSQPTRSCSERITSGLFVTPPPIRPEAKDEAQDSDEQITPVSTDNEEFHHGSAFF